MTEYERLMERSKSCRMRSTIARDGNTRAFWHDASIGFREKARKAAGNRKTCGAR